MSSRAVAWVIHDAPVPADLAWTLTVIAARCDEHGRGSYQSVPTIAEKAGKSPAQVERDIKRLRELGLILWGDQRLAEHLPKGRRPVVYDVPLALKGAKPVKASKNPTGKKVPKDATPRMDAGGGMDAPTSIHAGPTPRMDAADTPRMDAGQTTLLNNPLINPSLDPAEAAIKAATGATPEEAKEMIDLIIREWNVRTPDLYIPQMKPADLGVYLTRVRALRVTTPIPPPVPVVLAQARYSGAPAARDEELTDREKAIAYARTRVGVSVARPGKAFTSPPTTDEDIQCASAT